MQYSLTKTTSSLMFSAALLLGCGGDNGGESLIGGGSGYDFDVSEVGRLGMSWTGEATLLEPRLEFPETEMELSRRFFSMYAAPRDMSEFNNPPLEFRDSPVDMGLSISGMVEESEPGRMTLAIDSVRPRYSVGLGTSSEQEMREDLASNGIHIPEASEDNPLMVTLSISAADEDNREISATSDSGLIGSFVMRGGERSAL